MPADYRAAPFNPLPPVVWALLLAMGGVEAVLLAGAQGLVGGPEALGWRLALIQRIGFSGALWEWMVETRRFPPEHLIRLLAYPLVHATALQTLFVLVLLAALGKAVGDVLSGWALAVLVLASSAGGALVYATLWPEPVWLTGGYPAVFGLVGAFTVLIWTRAVAEGASRLRAFALVAVLLTIRVGLGLWHGFSQDWIADVAAFALGFALTFLLAPGGWRTTLDRLRHR